VTMAWVGAGIVGAIPFLAAAMPWEKVSAVLEEEYCGEPLDELVRGAFQAAVSFRQIA
jgi:hypothetical protein